MTEKTQVQALLREVNLPVLGIGAFSLCSVSSLYHLFTGNSLHPSPLYYAPAVLLELVTAWSVHKVVEQARRLTKSRISKQDKRFHFGILGAFVAVSVPLVSTSVWANTVEFGGNLVLGALFPLASIGCAVGAALPRVTAKFEQSKAKERRESAEERKAKAKERQKVAEIEARIRREQAEKAQREAERGKQRAEIIANLGKSAPVFELFESDPHLSQAEAAQTLGVTRQSVGYHLDKLEAQGAIKRNGNGVRVLA